MGQTAKFRKGDLELYYETKGKGEPLIFLNGIMMSTASWVYQKKYFSHHYHCIFHDFRDQLGSSPCETPYPMDAHAGDLRDLLDHLGVGRCHLVGTSYGGEVALLFALAFPERVQSLSVIASVSYAEPLLRNQVRLWQHAAGVSPQLLYESVAAFSYSNAFMRENPDLLARGADRLADAPAHFFPAFVRLCDAFLSLDITDRLGAIRCPVLLIAGGEDILKTPDYSRVMAQHIPGSELLVIPRAGHAVVLEQPEVVNGAVHRWLQAHAMR